MDDIQKAQAEAFIDIAMSLLNETDGAISFISGTVAKKPTVYKGTSNGEFTYKLKIDAVRDNTGVTDTLNMTAFNQIGESCAQHLNGGEHVKAICKVVRKKPAKDAKFLVDEHIINYIQFEDKEFKEEDF